MVTLRFLCFLLLVHASVKGVPAVAQSAPVSSLEDPELARLVGNYEKELREKVEAPYEAGIQRLKASYRATLDVSLKRVAAQGLLTEAISLQDETKRFADGGLVPEQDEPGTPAELTRLRNLWRAEDARLAKQRTASLRSVTEAHLALLQPLEKELTRSLKLDQAKMVHTRAENLKAPLAPLEPPPNVPGSSTPPGTPRATAMAPTPALTGWIGKTVRLNLTKDGATGLRIENDVLKLGDYEAKTPNPSSFKVAKGAERGSLPFESIDSPRFFIRHENFNLRLVKGIAPDKSSFFFLEKPMSGSEGMSIAAFTHPGHRWLLTEQKTLIISNKTADTIKAVFFLIDLGHR